MQKAWQVDFGPKKSVQDGRAAGGVGHCDGLRLRGVWRNSAGSFLPAETAGVKSAVCLHILETTQIRKLWTKYDKNVTKKCESKNGVRKM